MGNQQSATYDPYENADPATPEEKLELQCPPIISTPEFIRNSDGQIMQTRVLRDVDISLWKLNLLGIYEETLFVAIGAKIYVYNFNNDRDIRNPLKILQFHQENEEEQADINQIKVSYMSGHIPVLIVVNDAGGVKMFYLEDLDRRPIYLLNPGKESTWGIALNTQISGTPLLAVSANSKKITLWDLQHMSIENPCLIMEGHSHNIPCIDISPCGQYIASISIDSSVRVWNVTTGKTIGTQPFSSREWGWSCKWIPRWSIKTVSMESNDWQVVAERQQIQQPVYNLMTTPESLLNTIVNALHQQQQENSVEYSDDSEDDSDNSSDEEPLTDIDEQDDSYEEEEFAEDDYDPLDLESFANEYLEENDSDHPVEQNGGEWEEELNETTTDTHHDDDDDNRMIIDSSSSSEEEQASPRFTGIRSAFQRICSSHNSVLQQMKGHLGLKNSNNNNNNNNNAEELHTAKRTKLSKSGKVERDRAFLESEDHSKKRKKKEDPHQSEQLLEHHAERMLENYEKIAAAQVQKKNAEKSTKPADLLICTTFRNVILYDGATLEVLAELRDAIPRPTIPLPSFMFHMRRIAIVEYIPELSLLVLASQGSAMVSLVRIIQNQSSSQYLLKTETTLPSTILQSPIAGMHITRHISPTPGCTHFKLYLLYQNNHLFVYSLQSRSEFSTQDKVFIRLQGQFVSTML